MCPSAHSMSYLIPCEVCRTQLSLAEPIFRRRVVGHRVTLHCKKCDTGIEVDATALSVAEFASYPETPQSETQQALPEGVVVRAVKSPDSSTLAETAGVPPASPRRAVRTPEPALAPSGPASSAPPSVRSSAGVDQRPPSQRSKSAPLPARAGVQRPDQQPAGLPSPPSRGTQRAAPKPPHASPLRSPPGPVPASPGLSPREASNSPNQVSPTTAAVLPSRTSTVLGIQPRPFPLPLQRREAPPESGVLGTEPPADAVQRPGEPIGSLPNPLLAPLPSPVPSTSDPEPSFAIDELPTEPKLPPEAAFPGRPVATADVSTGLDDTEDRPTVTRIDSEEPTHIYRVPPPPQVPPPPKRSDGLRPGVGLAPVRVPPRLGRPPASPPAAPAPPPSSSPSAGPESKPLQLPSPPPPPADSGARQPLSSPVPGLDGVAEQPLPANALAPDSTSRPSPVASTAPPEPSIEIEVTGDTGAGLPEPATLARAAPSSPAAMPGTGEERENTAQAYSLAASGLSSSQPPPREPTVPAPRRRRTLLWVSVAAVVTIGAGAAGFVLLPAFRSFVLRLFPETQLSALGEAIRGTPSRILDGFGSSSPSRGSAPHSPKTRETSPALAKAASAARRPSAEQATSAAPSAGPPLAAPSGVGTPDALAQDASAPASPSANAEGPPATPDPHDPLLEKGAASATPDQLPLATVPEGVNQELVMQRVRAVMLRAEKCHPFGHAIGTARVTVTFEPDGKVSQATIEGEPVASAPVGSCVLAHAKSIIVPRFEGSPFQVTETVNLR